MNGKELLKAVDLLESEKHIDRQYIFDSLKLALAAAYKRNFDAKENVRVDIDEKNGNVKIFSFLNIVEEVAEPDYEISLEDAKKIDKKKDIGDTIETEITPDNFGRVAASTAKQVMIQKIREAERDSISKEFTEQEGELIVGVLSLEDENNYYVDLGRTNGILPKSELIGEEKLEMGSSVKCYVSKVEVNPKGINILLSRRHFNFVKRLFEAEIPELADGSIMIYGVAREAGIRSKVAVGSNYANIDPVGCCIGEHGRRISNILKELSGERIDIIKYDDNKERYITNALSPAKDVSVFILDPKKDEALAICDGDNFSLALGKKGLNIKLASRLTRFKIDVKTSEQAREMGISLRSGE